MVWTVPQVQAEEVPTTPSAVVIQWLQSYPHDLPQAVTLTSPDFRENLPPSEWITQKEFVGTLKWHIRFIFYNHLAGGFII